MVNVTKKAETTGTTVTNAQLREVLEPVRQALVKGENKEVVNAKIDAAMANLDRLTVSAAQEDRINLVNVKRLLLTAVNVETFGAQQKLEIFDVLFREYFEDAKFRKSETANETEMQQLRYAFLCLDKLMIPQNTQAAGELAKYFAGADTEEKMRAKLQNLGFKLTASYYAASIFGSLKTYGGGLENVPKDDAFLYMMNNLSSVPFEDMRKAMELAEQMSSAYRTDDTQKVVKLMDDYVGTGPAKKAMLSFVIARRYGDVGAIAEKMGVISRQKRESRQYEGNGKEYELYKEMIVGEKGITSKSNEAYAKNLEEYIGVRTAGKARSENLSGLDSLDVFGRYAFLIKTYPNMVRLMGDVTPFKEYIRTKGTTTQLEFTLYWDLLPSILPSNTDWKKITDTVSLVSFWGDNFVRDAGWNRERKLAMQGEKMLSAVEHANNMFLARMIRATLKNPERTETSRRPNQYEDYIKPEDFDQYTPVEITEREIKQFLTLWPPTLVNDWRKMLDIEGVKNPGAEELVMWFRRLMAKNELSRMQMQRPSISLGIALDLGLFQMFLDRLNVYEAIPSEMYRYALNGHGTYTRVHQSGSDATMSGDAYLEWTEWGPTARKAYWMSMSGLGSETRFTGGASGSGIYKFGRNNEYELVGSASTEGFKYIKGYFDSKVGDVEQFACLELNEETNKYGVTLWQRKGNKYVRMEFDRQMEQELGAMSPERVYQIFGAYLDNKIDSRLLFSGGNVKGLVIGYKMDSVGLAALKSRNQYAAVAAYSSGYNLGARAYLDKEGAKQLGLLVEATNMRLSAGAGKDAQGKGVYAVDYRQRFGGKTSISAMGVKHLDTLLAGGIDSGNAYMLLDYIKRHGGEQEGRVIAGFKTSGGMQGDVAWFSRAQNANFLYMDEYLVTYNELLTRRNELVTRKGRNTYEVENDLRSINYAIDQLQTVTDKKFRGAMRLIMPKKDGTWEIDAVSGASTMMSVIAKGPD
ncbi:MAG: hypothetical protein WC488_02150, partial [Candidatus Micrarchaeia archaeon]